MVLEKRIETFVKFGNFIKAFLEENNKGIPRNTNNSLALTIKKSYIKNKWFIEKNILFTLSAFANILTQENIEKWLKPYKINENKAKRIGVISAGNIPAVGLHDMISVLISGHTYIGKLSSKDNLLLPQIAKILTDINKEFENKIFFKDKLENFDAIIATGSNNSSRYFDYYFSKYPHIIRKNRNSVAIINGNETEAELKLLADDIFMYFGLGCRNVSKIFIPEGYDLNNIFKALFHYLWLNTHNKYSNNYDYNRAIYLMNLIDVFENGFVLFKNDIGIVSPIAVINYEYYSDINNVISRLNFDSDKIQCIVSKTNYNEQCVGFGETQKPKLWDYADNVDTISFLNPL